MIIPHRKPCLEGRLNVEGNIEELKCALNDLIYYKKIYLFFPQEMLEYMLLQIYYIIF
ncbi:hypothetical protein [Methanothermococcus okinawensis]|uniref:hypothetical protein n=1 Tax=Methanothermococcus okinawensis TaxID=155863 RepID=UPI0001E2DDE4